MLCNFIEFKNQDVGELLFLLPRLNMMNDFAYVPTTFGDELFQLRKLGEFDKSTLISYLDDEAKVWRQS